MEFLSGDIDMFYDKLTWDHDNITISREKIYSVMWI